MIRHFEKGIQGKLIRVFIIGGARGIGHWFAQNVTTKHPDLYETFLCDVSFDVDKRIDLANEILLGKSLPDKLSNLVTASSIVIFSVPIDKLGESLNEIVPLLPRSCLIINFCSVQATTNELINKMVSGHRKAIGIHFLFGPGTQALAGKNVVVTDVEEPIHSNRLKQLLRLMKSEGAFIEYSSADLHDRMMNLMQTLVHFVYLAFAKYLSVSSIRPKDLLKFQTLPSAYFFSFVARVLLQGKLTYANIQNQPGAQDVREAFLDAALNLSQEISEEQDSAVLASRFEKLSENFDQADLKRLFATTEGSILSFDDDALVFQNLMQSNELVLVKEKAGEPDERTLVGFVAENRKDTFVLRRVVFRLAYTAAQDTSKFCFWGDDFSEYSQNLSTSQHLIDQDDLVQNFVELRKSVSQISSGIVLQEWLAKSVEPICRSYNIVSTRFDKNEISSFCRGLKGAGNSIVSVDASDFKIDRGQEVHFKVSIQFFPPLASSGADALVDQFLTDSFGGNINFSTADRNN